MKKLGILCMMLCASLFVQAQELSVGAPMPSFKLNSTVYGKVNSADLKGKVVLISMFATWCGPCSWNWLKWKRLCGRSIRTIRISCCW